MITYACPKVKPGDGKVSGFCFTFFLCYDIVETSQLHFYY